MRKKVPQYANHIKNKSKPIINTENIGFVFMPSTLLELDSKFYTEFEIENSDRVLNG